MIDSEEFRSYASKMQRKREKDEKLLNFLIEEKFIFVENLHYLFEYKSKIPNRIVLRKSIKSLIKKGLLKHHVVTKKLINGYFSAELYHLTDSYLQDNLTEKQLEHIDDYRFIPSQIHIENVAHRFEMQQAMIRIMNMGYKIEKISYKQNKFDSKKIPDFFFYADNKRYAVEYERSVKTTKKYQEIFSNSISDIKNKYWDKILYVCSDKSVKNQVNNQLKKLSELIIDDEVYEITEEDRKQINNLFYFCTLNEINEKEFLI